MKEVLLQQRNEEEEKLLQWLTPIDHVKTQIDKAHGRYPETKVGRWLLDSPEFNEFLSERKSTLFCPGIPGAGKTVLTSVVVEYLLKARGGGDNAEQGKIGVAFIYLDFKQKFELVHLLGSMLRQLVPYHSSALDTIRKVREKCRAESRELSISEVREMLQSIAPSFPKLFIILDALDEGEQHVHGLLSDIFCLQQAHGANIFATSRHIPHIEARFKGANTLEIRACDEDIRNYVDNYMNKLPHFVMESSVLQEETKSGIIKAVDGM